MDFFKDLDIEVPAQVIEVPKISQNIIPQRSVDLVPQMVEQLVEVPTVLTPTRIAVQIAELSIPVPHGCGQGSLPGQGSSASGKRISKRIVEQIVDFPEQTVEQIVDTCPGDDCGLGSSSSAGPADEDFTGFFSHFSPWKKVRSVGALLWVFRSSGWEGRECGKGPVVLEPGHSSHCA